MTRTGRLIRDRRLDAGLTLRGLGKQAGVDFRAISRIETGQVRPESATQGVLRALADALEIDPASMLVAVASDLLGYSVTHEVAAAALELQDLPPAERRELLAAISAAAEQARARARGAKTPTAPQDAHASAQHRGAGEPLAGDSDNSD